MMQLIATRLVAQQLCGTKFQTPKEMVAWMGAMQAQDYNMAKWGIGIRLQNTTDQEVEKSFNAGEILRTHVLRPTWHFVSSADIRWMLELSFPKLKTSMASRDAELGINQTLRSKCFRILEKKLEGNHHLTKEELTQIFEKDRIIIDSAQMYHLMFHAEINSLVCSGSLKNKKHTYALLSERAPQAKSLPKEEALAMLAQRYFTSHGPATIQDFIWWSGLSSKNAQQALASAKKNLAVEKKHDKEHWFDPTPFPAEHPKNQIHLLPAFDEYIISYKERNAIFNENHHHHKAISSNGIFRPVILKDGKAIGLWKKVVNNKFSSITFDFFEKPDEESIKLIDNTKNNSLTFWK